MRMNDQHIARLEARLEGIVESALGRFLGKRVRAHEIAMQLARAMENHLLSDTVPAARPIAPDYYRIQLNPAVYTRLLEKHPALADALSQHLVELAAESDYRLVRSPVIELQADASVEASAALVQARHQGKRHSTTSVMQRVELPPPVEGPRNPQLVLRGVTPIALSGSVINIGRARDNDIVIDDPTVSRHHIQLRLSLGRYLLFDTNSQSGVLVNETPVREHRLQSGDVIRMGGTSLVYVEEPRQVDTETNFGPPVDAPGE